MDTQVIIEKTTEIYDGDFNEERELFNNSIAEAERGETSPVNNEYWESIEREFNIK